MRGRQMSDELAGLGTTLGAGRTEHQGVKHDSGPRAPPTTMFLSGSVFLFQMFVPRPFTQV